MNIVKHIAFPILVLTAIVVLSGVVSATTYNDTYVDPTAPPDEKNECSDSGNPCKLISRALTKTNNAGKIHLLHTEKNDPTGSERCLNPYDRVAIRQSVSIVGPEITIPENGMPCFVVNADTAGPARAAALYIKGDPTISVELIGLFIKGDDNGSIAVSFKEGAKLHVKNCIFSIYHGLSVDAQGTVEVEDSTFYSSKAILLDKSTTPQTATIKGCKFMNNGDAAILVRANRKAEVSSSSFTAGRYAAWTYSQGEISFSSSGDLKIAGK